MGVEGGANVVDTVDAVLDEIVEHLDEELNLKVSLFVHVPNEALPALVQHCEQRILQ